MKQWLIVAFIALCACSSSESSAPSSATGTSASTAPAVCSAPPGVSSFDGGWGCEWVATGQVCQVSNGATVLPDGGVANGTESCTPYCTAGEYEMLCRSPATAASNPPAPASSLNCRTLGAPEPLGVETWCCPCST